jgi:hypothetical protein
VIPGSAAPPRRRSGSRNRKARLITVEVGPG